MALRANPVQEWKDAAEVLDDFLDFDEWKQSDEDPFYDWRLIRKVRTFCCQSHE